MLRKYKWVFSFYNYYKVENFLTINNILIYDDDPNQTSITNIMHRNRKKEWTIFFSMDRIYLLVVD